MADLKQYAFHTAHANQWSWVRQMLNDMDIEFSGVTTKHNGFGGRVWYFVSERTYSEIRDRMHDIIANRDYAIGLQVCYDTLGLDEPSEVPEILMSKPNKSLSETLNQFIKIDDIETDITLDFELKIEISELRRFPQLHEKAIQAANQFDPMAVDRAKYIENQPSGISMYLQIIRINSNLYTQEEMEDVFKYRMVEIGEWDFGRAKQTLERSIVVDDNEGVAHAMDVHLVVVDCLMDDDEYCRNVMVVFDDLNHTLVNP